MCANDVVVQGAEPLFFLDYYATGRLDLDIAAAVIDGIANGCELAGAALIGGETAELPGMYQDGDYDLAGFCVGVVEKERLIDGSRVRPGDAVLGLASSGPHANGYSLIRKVLERGASLDSAPVDALLEPTRIYVKPLLKLMEHLPVHALAHITGGGLVENIPRVLPTGASVRLQSHCWPIPAVFDWLQKTGAIAESEMYRTFNMGIGMAIILPAEREAAALDLLTAAGETAWRIGAVEAGAGGIIIQ
jgi:phosphoribosylformylglycinamidine cyclo-ligase